MFGKERADVTVVPSHGSLAQARSWRQAFCFRLAVRHKRSVERQFTFKTALSLALSLRPLHRELQDISHKQTRVVLSVSGPDSQSIQRAEANIEGSWVKNQVLASESLRSGYIAYDCVTSRATRNLGTLDDSGLSSRYQQAL